MLEHFLKIVKKNYYKYVSDDFKNVFFFLMLEDFFFLIFLLRDLKKNLKIV